MDGFFFCTLKKSDKIDKWLKADNAPIAVREKLEKSKREKDNHLRPII
jgi:hypothetical protein